MRKTQDVAIEDHMDSNLFRMVHQYELDDVWRDGAETGEAARAFMYFRFEPKSISDYLTTSVCAERKYDYLLTQPKSIAYQVKIDLPKNVMILDSFNEQENEAFLFSQKIEQIDLNSVQIDYALKIKSNYIPADTFQDICIEKNELIKKLPLAFILHK